MTLESDVHGIRLHLLFSDNKNKTKAHTIIILQAKIASRYETHKVLKKHMQKFRNDGKYTMMYHAVFSITYNFMCSSLCFGIF